MDAAVLLLSEEEVGYLAVLEGEVWEEDLVAEVLVGGQEGGLVEDLGADLVVVPEAIDEAVDP